MDPTDQPGANTAATAATPVKPATAAASHRDWPVLLSLRGYQRSWLTADGVAALTLLAIVLPEQLATSRLAGMPPVTGWYAFIAGTTMFALLGGNPLMSVGADSTVAPLFAVGVARLATGGTTRYFELVGILAVTVGITVALVGLLRLGWIAEFMSAPIITGFLAGVAVIIVVHQLPDLLGVSGGGGSTVHRLHVVFDHLNHTNGWDVGIALAVLATVMASERIDRRVPGALIGLVGSTVLVSAAHLHGHGVVILGSFAHNAPHLGLVGLSWPAVRSILPLSAVVSLVIITQSAATSTAFADKVGGDPDISRDFVGVGAGSILAGLAGAFPVNASPPRTAAIIEARGRTQAAGLAAAVALVLLIPAAGVLKDLPLATLAAVLLFVASRIFHAKDLRAIAHFDAFEAALAAVTLLAVAFIGVEQGIAVAVVLAILDRTRLSSKPQLHVLGRIPGTTSWVPLSSPEHPTEEPGLLVVVFATPIWYANSGHFRAQVRAALAKAESPPRAMILDAIGMSDIDYTGSQALGRVLDELDRVKVDFAMARVGDRVRTSLERSGLLTRIGPTKLYPSVGEAVEGLAG